MLVCSTLDLAKPNHFHPGEVTSYSLLSSTAAVAAITRACYPATFTGAGGTETTSSTVITPPNC